MPRRAVSLPRACACGRSWPRLSRKSTPWLGSLNPSRIGSGRRAQKQKPSPRTRPRAVRSWPL
eukprot:11221435-Alexandrium_andersonii.AAC.1